MSALRVFSFDGRLRRLPYTLLWLPLLLSQSVFIVLSIGAPFRDFRPDIVGAVVLPLRLVILKDGISPEGEGGLGLLAAPIALLYAAIVAWLLLALAFRRATDAGINPWIAALALIPVIQIPALALLSLLPSRPAVPSAESTDRPVISPAVVAQGVVAGGGLAVGAVLLGAIVFGAYGYVMFIASPFLIGAVTAFIGNRGQDLGQPQTTRMVFAATILGGVALVATALEGVVCIVLAAPLGLGVAWLGGRFGRAAALRSRGRAGPAYAIAVLPLLFGSESLMPPRADFETVQTIEVEAPPARVWQAVLHMGRIDEPLALPFRLGVAYPLRAEIDGEGVGAIRRGEFSTGTALERITAWEPERKLAFMVETDIPAMHELSPYPNVRTPHLEGYFRTGETSFELQPLPGGRTLIVEHSAHSLRLDPVLYWLPLARWVVTANNARVLAHLKHQAEGSSSPAS